jgi:hypothetical protein
VVRFALAAARHIPPFARLIGEAFRECARCVSSRLVSPRRHDNAWTQTDRAERRRTVLTVLLFGAIVLLGLALLAWGLLSL